MARDPHPPVQLANDFAFMAYRRPVPDAPLLVLLRWSSLNEIESPQFTPLFVMSDLQMRSVYIALGKLRRGAKSKTRVLRSLLGRLDDPISLSRPQAVLYAPLTATWPYVLAVSHGHTLASEPTYQGRFNVEFFATRQQAQTAFNSSSTIEP
jgi:hypothetical protein